MNPAHSMRRTARAQAGFTLVELITVILILGVLAAVALPRYADLQGKARVAKVKAVSGSLKAAGGLVKAQAMADAASCTTASASVTMEGAGIATNYCYPQALGDFATGVLKAANVNAEDGWEISATSGETGGATGGSTVVIHLTGATTLASCAVSYTSPAAANGTPTVTAPTGGC